MKQKCGSIAVTAATLFCLLFTGAGQAAAQERTSVDSLRLRVDSLMRALDSLRIAMSLMQVNGARPAAVRVDTADPLAAIRAAAAAAAAGGGAADTTATPTAGNTQFVGRQRNMSMLNPEISVTGDIFGFVAFDEQSASDNFVPREFELSFVSNLDPYSRARIFVAHSTPGGEVLPFSLNETSGDAGDVEVEEGYAEYVNLPGGLSVALGKFRQRFGKFNRWHAHALPTQQLPLPYIAFFGFEGLSQAGTSVHWLAPIHRGGTYEAWGELRAAATMCCSATRTS